MMKNYDVYCYGMICLSNSFLLKDGFPKPDEYAEIHKHYRFPAGETGSCATVLSALGATVKIDGSHMSAHSATFVKEFYSHKTVDLSSLTFDEDFNGLEDYVLIADDTRTPMGTFGQFFADAQRSGIRHWNKPSEEALKTCKIAAIDPFFWDDSDLAAIYCVTYGKPYVTIDCKYDSYLHQHAAISIISGEGIQNTYPGKTRQELFPLFQNNSNGLTIITNGGKTLYYGRKGEQMKTFEPFKVNIASTLGAGDTFKAGCTYALLHGMSDEDTVKFASACAAVAISRYPLQLNPPTLHEIKDLMAR